MIDPLDRAISDFLEILERVDEGRARRFLDDLPFNPGEDYRINEAIDRVTAVLDRAAKDLLDGGVAKRVDGFKDLDIPYRLAVSQAARAKWRELYLLANLPALRVGSDQARYLQAVKDSRLLDIRWAELTKGLTSSKAR